MKEFIMGLFNKLWDLIVGKEKEEAPKEETPVNEKPKPEPKPKPEEKPKEEHSSGEPKRSKVKGEVTTFLWKPVADHSSNPVVVVGCDDIRSQDLKMEILGKKNKPLRVDIRVTGRANKLGHMKYGRINFRPQRTAKQFERSAPLKIRFYHTFTGKKKYVKVRGKDKIIVKKP